MTYAINETHDPKLKSWVESANTPDADFPIQNLPLGVFKLRGGDEAPRVGIAIGNQILDVAGCLAEGLLQGEAARAGRACASGSLNALMSLGPSCWSALRLRLSRLLRADCPENQSNPQVLGRFLVPISSAELLVPSVVGDFTDFYASIFHATNVGRMFRPDNPLLPNYKYVPVGYHGRSSSIVVSGTPVHRPRGQVIAGSSEEPRFCPSSQLDYEIEVGFFVGPGNRLGTPIPIDHADNHIFGFCLVNDWSARDIQRWEYQPLGPFLGKSFATSVSPWVVTLEALEPFRTAALLRPESDPKPLTYLRSEVDADRGGIDICVEVYLSTGKMRHDGIEPHRVSMGNFKELYWTAAQMLSHHTSNGCNLRPGDLIASGTVSGPEEDSRGCLLELTWRGSKPVALPPGEQRRFLEDGDEVILRGYCRRPGFVRIGLGDCRGVILPLCD